ncbi:MAG: DNA primase noncatalytic subunit PriX, partial [Candidatus Nitrosocosmicus sp.]|nr:DNA primase noncatalytic subunit PriX [Candidatus Nitrosocosmicus sp.]
MSINKGIDFLLYHFDSDSIFPRTIMTKKLGKQEVIYSKTKVLNHFEDSNYVDCRINAFPSYVDYKGIQRYPPDFIFIDLDRSDFKTLRGLQTTLSKTLKNISRLLDGSKPTVLWTGNGYHIYQPLESIILEQYDIFTGFERPSNHFLKFAKDYPSSGKADTSNNPSFRSCLLRIPYSFNSKCLGKFEVRDPINTMHSEDSQVSIIQEWNGFRPSIKFLLRDFLHYLINQKIKERNKMIRNISRNERNYTIFYENRGGKYEWIEQLLKTPLMDYRKHVISLILSPYLINVKKLTYQESYYILIEWLSQCNMTRKLDFNPNYLVKSSLNTASGKGIPPMRLDTLKNKNID